LLLLIFLLAPPLLRAASGGDLPVEMTVDISHHLGSLAPIWRFFGADEPNYATTATGKNLLMELGDLRTGEVFFRAHNLLTTGDGKPDFKWGSTNIYTEDHGSPVYDFSIVDAIIDTYRARGIHPYLEIGFMPEALSSAPPGVPYRRPWHPGEDYKGITAGWSYPPNNFTKWGELIYQWTRHNMERYGRAEVERWYFEVWNEPNLDFYWSAAPDSFYQMHDYAIAAVKRALPTARVGGPDVAGSGGSFMDGFLQHVTVGKNFATGQVGTPTDFLSFHAKGQPTFVDGHVRMGIANQLKTVDEGFSKIAAIPELAHKPIIIGENDPEGCAACPGPQNAYRNGSLYSSYTVASYARIWQLARERRVNLQGALTWAFTFDGQPWFAGYRQLATNGVDLPVLNVFRLFSRLGSEQLATTSSGQLSLQKIMSEGVTLLPDVGLLATVAKHSRVDILLWNYQDDDVPGSTAAVHIDLIGLPPGLDPRARVAQVGRLEGNAFTGWQSMGSPADPSQQQIDRLIRESRLKWKKINLSAKRSSAESSLSLRLPSQGVALIELGE
jgi:xylan 1,4-beta-xylosidase